MKHVKYLIVLTILISLFSCGKQIQETSPIRKDVIETVFASGILEPEGMYNLTAQTSGYLTEISFKEGDLITEGTILAVIENKENVLNSTSSAVLLNIAQQNVSTNSPALLQAKNTIATTKLILEQDSIQLERYKVLYQSNSVSKVDYENILLTFNTSKADYLNALQNYNLLKQQAEQQFAVQKAQTGIYSNLSSNNLIKAIVGGKVYQKFKQKGDFVKQGDIIATIGSNNLIYSKVNIDESSISKIKIGQSAIIQLNTNTEVKYNGKVIEILPSFDETTQSFICKIAFTDTLDFLIANTQLQANIIIDTAKNVLVIPRNYLSFDNTVKVKNIAEPVKVETKIVSSDWVQIISGIDEKSVLITDEIK